MSERIAIPDDVYERLKREKGDRSFGELIGELLETRTTLAEVSGVSIFDQGSYESVKDDITELSDGTARRLDDDT